jgi:DNA polymerase-4
MPAEAVYLHCDVDKMYYSVESLETPALADEQRAVIIGIDPRHYPRGVVTTANSVARSIGISSGMSCAIAERTARERGIEVLYVPPRHELYADYSRRLMDLLRTETPLLEQRSIDEAALDWRHHGFVPEPVLSLRQRILLEIGFSVSFGVAGTLLVAKLASEVAKSREDHVCVVPPHAGITTIGELAQREEHELVEHFGRSYGRYLHQASLGQDDSTLVDDHVYKSISAEHTFAYDTSDRAAIWRQLQEQARDVSRRLHGEHLVAREVAVKLRYGVTWETITRQQRLAAPTADAEVLAAGAAALMRKAWNRRPIRLIGLRAGRLEAPSDGVQLDLERALQDV